MLRARPLMHRGSVLAVAQWGAALILLLLWRIPGYALSLACLSLLGAWAGFAYFCGSYYASNSGNRSRNIGVNECLVGLGSFAGLSVSEWAMRRTGSDAAMYAVCAAALLISGGLQWWVASRPPR